MEKNRLEAFSDGVIAIIITIMVLEMKVSEGINWDTFKMVIPKFISYIISFLFVAIYWVNHHHLLFTIKKVNPSIMWANMNLLFWLSLIPFATAWMGENHFEKITVAVYALLALFCGFSYNILQAAICKTYDEETAKRLMTKQSNRKSIMSIVLYSVSIPIALFIHPFISGFLFVAVSIMWLIPDKNIEKALSVNG
jgi:uncharacterized membrane protein